MILRSLPTLTTLSATLLWFILTLFYDYLLLYLVSELSFVPFEKSFLADQDQGKCILAETRMAEEMPLRKTDKKTTEKQVPDVQTKPDDASFLWKKCSRTVNPYENMAHNTNKVSSDMESAKELLGMSNFYYNII